MRKILLVVLAALMLCNVDPNYAQPKTKAPSRIGLLGLASRPERLEEAFLQGLRNLGYIEGENIIIEYRWAGGKVERLPVLAEELVRLKVDVIAGRATPVIEALKNTTETIPNIVGCRATDHGPVIPVKVDR